MYIFFFLATCYHWNQMWKVISFWTGCICISQVKAIFVLTVFDLHRGCRKSLHSPVNFISIHNINFWEKIQYLLWFYWNDEHEYVSCLPSWKKCCVISMQEAHVENKETTSICMDQCFQQGFREQSVWFLPIFPLYRWNE